MIITPALLSAELTSEPKGEINFIQVLKQFAADGGSVSLSGSGSLPATSEHVGKELIVQIIIKGLTFEETCFWRKLF